MEANIVKIKEKELSELKLKGNLLYKNNNNYYFSDVLRNSLFVVDKDYKRTEETQEFNMNFNDYVTNFLEICSQVENKPSLLFMNYLPKDFLNILNGKKRNYKLVMLEDNFEENLKMFNDNTSFSCVTSNFIRILRELFESRSGDIPKNDTFIFLNEPETIQLLPMLDTLVTIARGRHIYFVINIVNKTKLIELYGPEFYKNIEDNCPTKFICDNSGVVEIQPSYNTKFKA